MENKPLVEIVGGDTDSLYLKYENLLDTIVNEDGSELSDEQKLQFLIRLNTEFIDQHNEEFMGEFYKKKHSLQMVQRFELETIALADIRLDVKKRYCQMLAWKDGKIFDIDSPKYKAKGLETVKASYPELARNQLTETLKKLLMTEKEDIELVHFMNQLVQQCKQEWMTRPVEDLCENKGINGYTKYIVSDNNPEGVEVAPKCPYHVRALATRNWCIQTKGERGELQYGGKMKVYPVKKTSRQAQDQYFAFMAGEYPVWAEKYMPCDRNTCFQKFFLDPLNRILGAIGSKQLSISGDISFGLFD